MNGMSIGTVLIVAGGVLVLAGLAATSGALDWFGHLPGDIRIERGNTRVYLPLTSMLVVSVVLSVVVHLVHRFFG